MQIGLNSYNERRDAVLSVALLLFAAFVWFYLIPEYAGGHGEHVIVAEIAAVMIAALAGLMGVLTFLGVAVEADTSEDPFLNTSLGAEPAGLWWMTAIWGACVFGLHGFGFYAGGGLALALTFLLLDIREPLKILAIVSAALLGIYVVFELGFHLDLPKGTLFHGLIR
ncbi:MAG: hypothetical protein AB7U38_00700 [Hyphomicrobiales bacterium]